MKCFICNNPKAGKNCKAAMKSLRRALKETKLFTYEEVFGKKKKNV